MEIYYKQTERYTQIDEEIYRYQIYGDIHRYMERYLDRQRDTQIDGEIHRQMERYLDIWRVTQIDCEKERYKVRKR